VNRLGYSFGDVLVGLFWVCLVTAGAIALSLVPVFSTGAQLCETGGSTTGAWWAVETHETSNAIQTIAWSENGTLLRLDAMEDATGQDSSQDTQIKRCGLCGRTWTRRMTEWE
jgi:hypothetical protein